MFVFFLIDQEPMDTSESLKSETPQPATKEQSPQKEQIENNAAGMSHSVHLFLHTCTLFFLSMHFERTAKQYKNIKQLTNAFAYVFDCVELLFVCFFVHSFIWPLNNQPPAPHSCEVNRFADIHCEINPCKLTR